MLQFPYRNLLKPYEYNQTAFLCDLAKRIDVYEQLSRQSERTEQFHLPVADQTAGETLRKILRNSVNIPDHMCAGKADREAIRMFEKGCRQIGRRIPYAVGKQLEDIFISAKNRP